MRPAALVLVLLFALAAQAGGPLVVGSARLGVSGEPLRWNPAAMPIVYHVDGGPLSRRSNGTVMVSNTEGVSRVRAMFQVWEDVPTASISYSASSIQATSGFYDGDVSTVAELDAVEAACDAGTQSPIIFDADGSIFQELFGDSGIIGFAGPCSLTSEGHIRSGEAVLNGEFQDQLTQYPGNYELTTDEFDSAFIHEFGHFSGLDHSQINVTCLSKANCIGDYAAGLPTMWPILVTVEMKTLAADDIAWISRLYPEASFAQQYGAISGTILFADGVSQVQGVNVIARRLDDPATPEDESKRIAVSVVSGYLFTGNPGQSVTANYLPCVPANKCPGGFHGNNTEGSWFGSRDAKLIGYYEVPVPPGTYTIEVEALDQRFSGGSSVGPIDPPMPAPSASPPASDPVTVAPGETVRNVNVIYWNTPSRFDQFEEPAALWLLQWAPLPGAAKRERAA